MRLTVNKINNLPNTKRFSKYRIVFIPKDRKKAMFGQYKAGRLKI